MKPLLLSAVVLVLLGVGCGTQKQQLPAIRAKIFSLDNEKMLLRYRYNEVVIPLSDPQARGSVCFLPDDFERMVETLLSTEASQ